MAFRGAQAAWGGSRDVPPPGLRIASAGAAIVLIVAALIILGAAQYWASNVPYRVFSWGSWVLVVAMTMIALGNVASSIAWERYLLGPVAAVLALLCLVVVLGSKQIALQR